MTDDPLGPGVPTLPLSDPWSEPEGPNLGLSTTEDALLREIARAPGPPLGAVRRIAARALMKRCTRCGVELRSRSDRCPVDGSLLETLPDPLVGELLGGRYRLEHKIGSGGMSTVYRARHHWIGRELAVKVLLPAAASDPGLRRRFVREAQTIHRISHRHIVEVLDFGETSEGDLYLVMEYLRGHTLAESLQRGPLRVVRALAIVRQIAEALARTHALDVVHRDVKPSNVFLVEGAEFPDFVKLLDFGIAKVHDGLSTLTGSGIVLGTPDYMSPEQVRGQRVGPRTDLYSVGCLLYETLAGRPPFSGNTHELLRQHLSEVPKPLAAGGEPIPEPVEQLVVRLLAKNPEDRHRDAHHLLEELAVLERSLAVAGVLSARPAAHVLREPSTPGRTLDEQSWSPRITLYRRLSRRVSEHEPVPVWLTGCLDSVERDAAALTALRQVLTELAQRSERVDAEAQGTRVRIGFALDSLSREESHLVGEISVLQLRIASEEAEIEQVADQMTECLERAMIAGAASRELAELTRRFSERRESIKALRAKLADNLRSRDDLGYQIRELKERLESFNGEAEASRQALSRATEQKSAELAQVLTRMTSEMERVYLYLFAFPQLAIELGKV